MSIPPILGSVYHLLLFSVASVFYLLIRMLGVVVAVLLYIFAPLTHLLQYLVRGALIPVHILGKFEVSLDIHAVSPFYKPSRTLTAGGLDWPMSYSCPHDN
jgi:hypothetical protein